MGLENILMALFTGVCSIWLLFVGFSVSKPFDKASCLFAGVVFGTMTVLYGKGIL